MFNTISVIGLGYIGLPTAAAFASRQKKVIGVDINTRAVETINRGDIHIVEPDLDVVVKTAVEQGYLRATTRPERCRRRSKTDTSRISPGSKRRPSPSRRC